MKCENSGKYPKVKPGFSGYQCKRGKHHLCFALKCSCSCHNAVKVQKRELSA